MKKVTIISLGCEKNLVDSENILGLLDHDKYTLVGSIEESDIVIINTCGFIEPSKRESIQTILDVIPFNKKIVVTGCLVERYIEDLKIEIPEVSLWIPIREYSHFNDLLSSIDDELTASGGLEDKYRIISTGDYSAYLKIGEGCDNRCSYCAIPLIRGGFKSRSMSSILEEAKLLESKGYKELIILEQDTTKYGIDLCNGENIVSLLKELLKFKGFKYIRLLYLYPDEISNELIDLISKEERLTPYFDIPIQHSETHILESMNRRGNKEYLYSLFKSIKQKIPHAIFRTTIMVGFPGETEMDVSNLIDFISDIEFDHLGCFTYSKEEGTASFNMTNQIDETVKEKRKDLVMKAQQKISYKKCKSHIGEIMQGIIIGKEKGYYLLRSYWNAPGDIDGKIFVSSKKELKEGDIIKVQITDAFVYDLFASLKE